jgi:thioredoxin 1
LESISKKLNDNLFVIMVKAEWCAPCELIYPKVLELSQNYPSVKFYEINIDDEEHQDIILFLNPTRVPSFFLYKNGQILDFLIGTYINKLEDLINNLL